MPDVISYHADIKEANDGDTRKKPIQPYSFEPAEVLQQVQANYMDVLFMKDGTIRVRDQVKLPHGGVHETRPLGREHVFCGEALRVVHFYDATCNANSGVHSIGELYRTKTGRYTIATANDPVNGGQISTVQEIGGEQALNQYLGTQLYAVKGALQKVAPEIRGKFASLELQ